MSHRGTESGGLPHDVRETSQRGRRVASIRPRDPRLTVRASAETRSTEGQCSRRFAQSRKQPQPSDRVRSDPWSRHQHGRSGRFRAFFQHVRRSNAARAGGVAAAATRKHFKILVHHNDVRSIYTTNLAAAERSMSALGPEGHAALHFTEFLGSNPDQNRLGRKEKGIPWLPYRFLIVEYQILLISILSFGFPPRTRQAGRSFDESRMENWNHVFTHSPQYA